MLPLSLNPVVGYIGQFPVMWYAIAYIAGAFLSAWYFVYLSRKNGLLPDISVSIDLIVTILWSVVIGARLGYVFFYGGDEFFREPWRIISPYDFKLDQWIGIRGMSFHGGLLGGAVGLWMFTREAKRYFFDFSDVLVQAVPIALLFGRIGNFLNLEIIGKATTLGWGVYFPMAGVQWPRHPVTLYEAFFEGIFLFLLLFVARRFLSTPGRLTGLFLVAYALLRAGAEVFRALPDGTSLVFGLLTTGQLLSLVMGVAGSLLILFARPRMV